MSTEAVAKWMIERSYATGHGDTIEDLLKELEWQIREREREEFAQHAIEVSRNAIRHEREQCAKIADQWVEAYPHPSTVIADQIRARGNK